MLKTLHNLLIKITVLTAAAFFVFACTPAVVFAEYQPTAEPGKYASEGSGIIPSDCYADGNYGIGGIITLIGNIIKWAEGVSGALALLMFFIGGYLWIFAGASQKNIENGKNLMVNATIGLLIVFGSWVAINFFISSLTGPKSAGGVAQLFNSDWNSLGTEVCFTQKKLETEKMTPVVVNTPPPPDPDPAYTKLLKTTGDISATRDEAIAAAKARCPDSDGDKQILEGKDFTVALSTVYPGMWKFNCSGAKCATGKVEVPRTSGLGCNNVCDNNPAGKNAGRFTVSFEEKGTASAACCCGYDFKSDGVECGVTGTSDTTTCGDGQYCDSSKKCQEKNDNTKDCTDKSQCKSNNCDSITKKCTSPGTTGGGVQGLCCWNEKKVNGVVTSMSSGFSSTKESLQQCRQSVSAGSITKKWFCLGAPAKEDNCGTKGSRANSEIFVKDFCVDKRTNSPWTKIDIP